MTVEEWKKKNPPICRKPKTNYDLLISKTPEEMAKWLTEKIHCIGCPQKENCMLYERSINCRGVLLDWLKSPADRED